MKQHIDKEQFEGLSPGQQKKLFDWWYDVAHIGNLYIEDDILISINCCNDEIDKEDCIPLLSVGQMIEFLDNSKKWYPGLLIKDKGDSIDPETEKWFIPNEFCDALWEAVKEALNENNTKMTP